MNQLVSGHDIAVSPLTDHCLLLLTITIICGILRNRLSMGVVGSDARVGSTQCINGIKATFM